MVESGTEGTSFVILLQEINDFSFDYFLSSVVEIRCHSRYCNYVTQLLFKGALLRFKGALSRFKGALALKNNNEVCLPRTK